MPVLMGAPCLQFGFPLVVFYAIIGQSRISQDFSKLFENAGIVNGEEKRGMRNVVKVVPPFS